MSFFGFDTSMPPGLGPGGDSLDERLRKMAEADENLAVYDWEAGGLDEALDEFNDDTFGLGGDVGKDFDFAGTTSAFLGSGPGSSSVTATAAPAQAAAAAPAEKKSSPFHQITGKASPFASLNSDPLLGPVNRTSSQQGFRPSSAFGTQRAGYAPLPTSSPSAAPSPFSHQQPAPRAPTAGVQANGGPAASSSATTKPKVRTLEEIEAEMQAQAQTRASQQSSPAPAPGPVAPGYAGQARPTPPPSSTQPRTLEEIEAEMMRKQATAARSQPQEQPYLPAQQPESRQSAAAPGQITPGFADAVRYQQQQQQGSALDQLFPALPGNGSAPLGLQGAADPNILQSVEAHIKAQEEAELRRHRKAEKIHRMAKYNNLMTQGDKDFITRIQVSQLVNSAGPQGTHDPYVDDFYFSVMQSLKQSRMPANPAFGPPAMMGGPPGNAAHLPQQQQQGGRNGRMAEANNQRRMTRRENAMNRMAQQVQRLVEDSKKKQKSSQLALEGALGKIAVRTRSAPRPLLQVDSHRGGDGEVQQQQQQQQMDNTAASHLSSSLNQGGANRNRGHALTRKEILSALEHVYDLVLQLEQSRRMQPALAMAAQTELSVEEQQKTTGQPAGITIPSTARAALAEHELAYAELVEKMWKGMKVMDPLDVSSPHPFVALLSVTKGKRLLPRVLRHMNQQQTLTLLTLLVATFDTLDVVVDAHILDSTPNQSVFAINPQRKSKKQVQMETEAFLNAAVPLMMGTISRSKLRIVTGMMGLLAERNDLVKVAKTKPGLAFLTVLLSRAQSLKDTPTGADGQPAGSAAEPDEISQWTATFNYISAKLSGHLNSLFPSTRSRPFGPGLYAQQQQQQQQHSSPSAALQAEAILDADDEPVWHFLAALAVSSDMSQQQALVTEVREKVLENVMKAKNAAKNAAGQNGEAIAAAKLRNVNTFLHALGLDASQITVE